jgi:hypothetical protein
MRKRLPIAVLAVLVVAAVALPASARGWAKKVTGGGQAVAGGTYFSITVSAHSDGESVAGQMQYSRDDLAMHAMVECLGLFSENSVAVAAGPAKEQHDPTDFLGESDWMVVQIKEGGVGAGDAVRVNLVPEQEALRRCQTGPSGGFPGVIYDGNFNIRTK